ncbi:MAG TPA: TldD/PmbA family protein [Candidatus Cloacimonetes bacterium]|nr:TldD/PmbA family protein [Candidatus Cloacimonadota bacterium]HEX38050.1 TldD/PmbA family protein [Candidatus Cloacimonadota bacterium]
MEKLLEMAKKVCDQAEIYYNEPNSSEVLFQKGELHDIESQFQSGIALRIIKDGKLGFSYTKNLIDREEFLQNALDSLKGGVKAGYSFPLTKELPQFNTYDPHVEKVTSVEMVDHCQGMADVIMEETDAELEIAGYKETRTIRIMNTNGTDLQNISGSNGYWVNLIYPGGGAGLSRIFEEKKPFTVSKKDIAELIELYNSSSKVIDITSDKMQVLFMPGCMYTFLWRLLSGTSAKSIFENISPIKEDIGKKIMSDMISFYDDPHDDSVPGARSFDDEGVRTRKFSIIEKGVLKNFFYDLNYAKKLNAESTGHGYRSSMWGGDPITMTPTPSLRHPRIEIGDKSFEELVSMMDTGIILDGAMGAHSGNIPNGDYSVGVSPGLYVENGEIIGRVKDVMVAGNVYDTLKKVIAVENKLHTCWGGRMPAILCENISVSSK